MADFIFLDCKFFLLLQLNYTLFLNEIIKRKAFFDGVGQYLFVFCNFLKNQ